MKIRCKFYDLINEYLQSNLVHFRRKLPNCILIALLLTFDELTLTKISAVLHSFIPLTYPRIQCIELVDEYLFIYLLILFDSWIFVRLQL